MNVEQFDTLIRQIAGKMWSKYYRHIYGDLSGRQQTASGYADYSLRHDLIQEGRLACIKAIQTYDANKGPLDKRVGYCVHKHLLMMIRKAARRDGIAKVESSGDMWDLPEIPIHEPSQTMADIVTSATGDMRMILDEFLALPGKIKARGACAAKRWIVKRLRESGWNIARITDGFSEISEAIC